MAEDLFYKTKLNSNFSCFRPPYKSAGPNQGRLGICRQHMGGMESSNICRPISLNLLFNIAAVLEIEPARLLEFRQ